MALVDRVVLCCGEKRTGKNEVAKVLRQRAEADGYTVYELAFADELRRHLGILNPIVGRDPWSMESNITWNKAIELFGYERAKDKFPEMRRLMQVYGTELVRDLFDSGYWVDKVTGKTEECFSIKGPVMVIVTDCRFDNERWGFSGIEWDYIGSPRFNKKPCEVAIVKLYRPDNKTGVDAHRSEQNLSDDNYPRSFGYHVIQNDSTLEDFHQEIHRVANLLLAE